MQRRDGFLVALSALAGAGALLALQWLHHRLPQRARRKRRRVALERSVGYREHRRSISSAARCPKKCEAVFNQLAGEDRLLDFSEFEYALKELLMLDLATHEIERIWARVATSKDNSVPLRDRQIDLHAFGRGVLDVAFLRQMVTQLQEPPVSREVPAWYDFDKSTNENYRSTKQPFEFHGEFQELRKPIDYNYHSNYTKDRQLWQDWAVISVVSRTKPKLKPWIVYTCGPMGAGKGYALAWMSKNGYFPLEDIVHIDPDNFKRIMPEWSGYTARSDRAGDLCHRESGFIQEIAQEVAMRNSQNVWIDGSLRDGDWFSKVFKDVRRRFPNYKIAIFEVGASEEAVRARIKKRATETGRDVPEHLIRASLASVASSLEKLTPLSDFVARISNEGVTPTLRAYIRVDNSGDWGRLEKQFAKPDAGSFPHSLAPLALVSISLDVVSHISESSLTLNLQHSSLAELRPFIQSARMDITPRWKCGVDGEARQLAGVPEEAVTFCWANPASLAWNRMPPGLDLCETECQLLLLGGFVLFDRKHQMCSILAASRLVDGFSKGEQETNMLQFSAPEILSEASVRALGHRFKPVTLASLIEKGATEFAWMGPNEVIPGLEMPPRAGAFAYLFEEEGGIYFPVAND